VRASGPPNEVLTRDVVEEVFEWPVEIEDRRGIPQVVPLRRHER
jgi:ABC-type hemin transport system ATPase subunit